MLRADEYPPDPLPPWIKRGGATSYLIFAAIGAWNLAHWLT